MEPNGDGEEGDRRQSIRRDEDAVLYHRVNVIEHNLTALASGPTLDQLEKLDLRYQPRAELLQTFATREDLEREFLNRDQLRNEYVPRVEHSRRFDNWRNLALVLIAFGALIEPLLLHH